MRYSMQDEGKPVVVEIVRTLQKKIHKYMTSFSNIVYFDKLDGIFNENNNIYNRTMKTKPNDLKTSKYFDFGVKNNDIKI